MIQVTSKLTYVCFVVKVANLGNASDNTSGFQSFLNRISLWFRSLSHCFGNCFGGSATDDDQLLRDGPSQSASVENNFNASIVRIFFVKSFSRKFS